MGRYKSGNGQQYRWVNVCSNFRITNKVEIFHNCHLWPQSPTKNKNSIINWRTSGEKNSGFLHLFLTPQMCHFKYSELFPEKFNKTSNFFHNFWSIETTTRLERSLFLFCKKPNSALLSLFLLYLLSESRL